MQSLGVLGPDVLVRTACSSETVGLFDRSVWQVMLPMPSELCFTIEGGDQWRCASAATARAAR